MRVSLVHAGGPMIALAACSAPPAGHLAPEGVERTFEFLALKYDRDGDGAVEPAEYTRASEGFAKLDANADGKLTPEDFPDERWARDLGIRDIPAEQRESLGNRYAARAVVLAYFGPDAAPGDPALTREALEQGFARLDLDASGVLDAAEFARATDALPWGGPGDAWPILVAAVDAPPAAAPPAESAAESPAESAQGDEVAAAAADGLVSLEELRGYHEKMAGAEGILRGPPGVDPRAAAPGFAGDGPPVGSLAPDFELAPPEGGQRFRLSEWRGVKPVALVFGSYT